MVTSKGFQQHVTHPTHIGGSTLDLDLTISSSDSNKSDSDRIPTRCLPTSAVADFVSVDSLGFIHDYFIFDHTL